jgi:hypothetical protein
VPIVLAALGLGWISFLRATRYPVPHGPGAAGALEARGGRVVYARSSLERRAGVWILRVEGTPWELGAARGRLLAGVDGAGAALDAALVGDRAPRGWLTGASFRASVRWRYRLLATGLPAARREELAGLAAGLRVADAAGSPSYQALVRRAAALDVGAAPGLGVPVGGVSSGPAFAAASNDGARVVLARSFELGGVAPPPEPVVTIARPSGKLAWAGVGWSEQVGVVTGVNAEGLAVALVPSVADDVRRTAAAEPLPMIARDVLEECATLDDAIALVKRATPLGAGSFVIVDGKTRAFAIVERTPTHALVRRAAAGDKPRPLWAGDFLQAPELAKDAEAGRGRRVWGRGDREARFSGLAARASGEPASALAVLRDRRGAAEQTLPLGHPSAIDDLGAQHVVVIDPVAMLLWVGGPGAAGPLVAVDLGVELAGAAPRVLAPEQATLVAAPDVDAGELDRAMRARAETVAAARWLRLGKPRAAAEAAARATALAPELPDAWGIAARAARRLGDADAARTFYREYLARAPAEAAAVEEARGGLP